MTRDIYFYIPEHQWPHPLPSIENRTWNGYKWGIYCWTLQTYYRLRSFGFHCHLTNVIPDRGIIIAHRGLLGDDIVPKLGQTIICLQADWSRHPYAYAHIAQNRAQTKPGGVPKIDRFFMPGPTHFVHHWPQAGLLPRDPNRSTELKTIYYFGLEQNLAPELNSADWRRFIKSLDVEWHVITDGSRWMDYRNADAVLFARDFAGRPHINKPATKLYNTWLAGSVPICTPESAYIDEIKSDHDAVIVDSYEDLKIKIRKLHADSHWFESILKAGEARREEYQDDVIAKEWTEILLPYKQLNPSMLGHVFFLASRTTAVGVGKVIERIRALARPKERDWSESTPNYSDLPSQDPTL